MPTQILGFLGMIPSVPAPEDRANVTTYIAATARGRMDVGDRVLVKSRQAIVHATVIPRRIKRDLERSC